MVRTPGLGSVDGLTAAETEGSARGGGDSCVQEASAMRLTTRSAVRPVRLSVTVDYAMLNSRSSPAGHSGS